MISVPPSTDCSSQNPKPGVGALGGAAALHHAVHCSVPASTPETPVPASPTQGISTLKLHTVPSHEVALSSCGWQTVGSTFDVVVVNMLQPNPAPELELELAPPEELEPPLLLAPPEELPELPEPLEPEPPGPGLVVWPPHAAHAPRSQVVMQATRKSRERVMIRL
jgi:hypothetical protein